MLVLFAEFLGTFALLSAVLFTGSALWIGATLAFIIYSIGSLSGGHVNPVISLAFYLKGSMSMPEFLSYVVVQVAGAVAAYYAYSILA